MHDSALSVCEQRISQMADSNKQFDHELGAYQNFEIEFSYILTVQQLGQPWAA